MSNTTLSTTDETASFELVQRQAKLLASSTLVPKDFQGNMSNCAIGLNIAKRLGADAFMVIQNIDIIHGRPSFRGKFLIAMVNASGRFSPLNFRFDGEGDNYGCTAYAKDRESGEVLEGPKVDWNMVKGEGWIIKPGSKWKTMPALMFRYRAGAYFANIYAPDITLGMMTSEESYEVEPETRIATGRVVDETVKLQNPYAVPDETAFADLKGAIPDDAPQAMASKALAKGMAEALESDPDNPFIQGHAQALDPQPTGETPLESPVEVSEATERAQLIEEIKQTCAEVEITFATFGGKAKSVGLLDAKIPLLDAPIAALRTIHDNRLAVAQGTYKAGGEG